MVVSNIVRENIEVTNQNKRLYDLQIRITDICNFILNYLDIHQPSEELKDNLVNIIDNAADVKYNLNVKDKIIAYSMNYVMKLYNDEKSILRS